MFCIQDPSYENSKYLHETLLAECAECVVGAGAYAFASKDGINLFFDDNFKKFMENGTYTLVVGTDDITNENAITALIALKNKYNSHLQIKAYIHSGKGSTFHPKFSWFKKSNGGTIVLGSGNLTQKGLRYNREAYNVAYHNEEEMKAILFEWEKWFNHSEPFLFDVEEPIVMEKARLNTKKIRAVCEVKAELVRLQDRSNIESELSGIYGTQPKNRKPVIRNIINESEVGSIETNRDDTSIITDEDIDVDSSYWIITNDSPVLIAEIPRSGNRWKQANFDRETFEHYFGATCGENGEYRILLKNVNTDGSLKKTEVRPSVSVSSQNYRFELEAASGLEYPEGAHRPIAIFAKVSCRDFIYELLMPGEANYTRVQEFIKETPVSVNRVRRLRYNAREVIERIPNLAIWKRIEEEEL